MPRALRRGLALVLLLGMVAAAGGPALAAIGSVPFTDLADVPWAVPGVTALQQQGVLLGVAPGIFDPSAPVSRAQMATVLGRLLGWPASSASASATFQDASTIPSWALPYVVTAAQDGILVGLPGGLFAPSVNVTWDQLAVIVARAYTYPQVLANQIPALVSQLPTGTQTPSWAIEAVAQDVQAGDFSGVLTDLYKPDQPVTRAELAAYLLQVEQSKGSGSAPVNGSVTAGQVTAVTGTTLTINNQSVPISPNASVYVGSASSNLSAVQVGDSVSVVLSAGQAILINVTATPGGSSATSLSGTITAISSTQLGLSVPGQTAVELPIDPTATVTVNGASSTLQAVQAGQQATVSLDSSGNVAAIAVTGTTAATTASTVTGVVASVTATEIALTPSGGSQQSYPLATNVTVNGLTGNLGAVTTGATVTLTLTGGQVTAIATGGALAISTTSLAAAAVGSPYTASLAASGGAGGYVWTATGAMPPGLAFSGGGVLSGTPTSAGTYAIAVQVADSAGATATAVLSLTVAAAAGSLAVVTATLPTASVNQAYSTTLAATGGTGTYTWTATGTLPQGLSLTAGGVLSGTPTASGTYTIPVAVDDSSGATATASLSLTVAAASGGITIVTSNLPAGTVGQAYTVNLAASGGLGTVTWSYSGSLPPGLSVSSAGLLSGVPTATGSYTFSIVATDSAGNMASRAETVAIVAAGGTIVVTTSNLPAATLNQPYSASLSAQGGVGGDSWTYSGPLPAGIALMLNGQISGTPTTSGSFTFTVTVTDTSGSHASATLTLEVQGGSAQANTPLGITTTSLPAATMGVAYATTLTATGGSGGYNWTYTGSLAPGLGLSQSGVLSGTPTASGTFYITAQVSDNINSSTTQSLTLTVNPPAGSGSGSGATVTVTTSSLPGATLDQAYSTALAASGGTGNYTWVYTGSLPQGLSLSTSGVISGTPTTSGTYTIYVQAVDSTAGSVSAARQLTLAVAP